MARLVLGQYFGFDPSLLKHILKTGIIGATTVKEPLPHLATYVSQENVVWYSAKDGYFSAKLEGTPSQCGCAMLHQFDVFNRNEIWDQGLKQVDEILDWLGYSKVLCTMNNTQKKANYIEHLSRNGWKIIDEFDNKRSGQHNYILTKNL